MTDPYVYPGTHVLKNKQNIQDFDKLEILEYLLVSKRIKQSAPKGDFDMAHLQAIHRHLFQDVYEWAGELRTITLIKDDSQFMPPNRMEGGMHDIHNRLVRHDYLRGLSPKRFAVEAGPIMGDVNYVHPFREGNGRTQFQYLKQLATQAGHELKLRYFERDSWINASQQAHRGVYRGMTDCICIALEKTAQKSKSQTEKETEKSGRKGKLILPPSERSPEEREKLAEKKAVTASQQPEDPENPKDHDK